MPGITLGPGQATTRYEGNSGGDLYNDFQQFSGTARITATGPVVATANQTPYTPTSGQNPSGAYNALRSERVTATVALPLIQADWYGCFTSMTCANASTSQAAQVNFRYTSDGQSGVPNRTAIIQRTIPAGGSIIVYERDRNGSLAHINTTSSPWYNSSTGTVRFNGSAFVYSATPGANVVCVVNEEATNILLDNMNTYNGVSLLNPPQ